MRVVHVNDILHQRGGVERYLARMAAAAPDVGLDVSFVTGHAPGTADPFPGPVVELHGAGVAATARAEHRDALRGALRDLAPDVVHVHNWSDVHSLSAAFEDAPVVRTFHDHRTTCSGGARFLPRIGRVCPKKHGPLCLVSAYTLGCNLQLPSAVARSYAEVSAQTRLYESYAQLVTASDAVKEGLISHGADPDRVTVIPYFPLVDAVLGRPEPGTVLFVGRVIREKGLDLLVRALVLVPEATKLIIAGDGPELPRVMALARRLRVGERIEALGWLGPERLGPLYARASVVAVPSRWPEPFGIVGVEAMAAQRPVVAADVGGVRSWLRPGETGLLHPAGDVSALANALHRVLTDPALATRLGARGADDARTRFSMERHLASLSDLYQTASSGTLPPTRTSISENPIQ